MKVQVNEKQGKYLYQYDTQYQVGMKLTFLNSKAGSVTNHIIQTLSKQYIQKILYR